MPATSQLDWLSSTTAMIVLFWSRATRDLLKSFGWGIAALHRLHAATKLPSPRRPPHRISRSHPERQRFEGRPLGPAHRSRFRSRALLRSAIVLRGLRRRHRAAPTPSPRASNAGGVV